MHLSLECFGVLDDDEILAIYADSISRLVPLVGTSQNISLLLEPLEHICKFEDIVIQDAVCFHLSLFYPHSPFFSDNKSVTIRFIKATSERI